MGYVFEDAEHVLTDQKEEKADNSIDTILHLPADRLTVLSSQPANNPQRVTPP